MLLGWHSKAYYSNAYMLNQYLASRGFVVLVQAAGRFLQSRPGVDASRVGVFGGFYGGYLTAMGLSRDSGLFKAGVDWHGVHDWSAQYDVSGLFARKRYETSQNAEAALRTAWLSSPVSSVGTWRSPVLFIHGDDDRNVKFAQSADLVRRLQGTGVPVETLALVDETHALARHESVLRVNAATVEFLERQLGSSR